MDALYGTLICIPRLKGFFVLKIEQRVALNRDKRAASYDETKHFGKREDFVSFVCALIISADID
jgi:hypothetical protein